MGWFLKYMMTIVAAIIGFGTLSVLIIYIYFRRRVSKLKALTRKEDTLTIGLFHPYCNAGGGGERVLWSAIKAMQTRYPGSRFVVYTGDVEVSPDEIVNRVKQRFNISLLEPPEFVYLHRRRFVEASLYPYFTLLGQSLGSLLLGLEAITKCVPDVYIDTMGYAFTLPLFKYLGECKVACYTHYPTISTDMLRQVSNRVAAHNNRTFVARSPVLSALKSNYYRMFAWLYGWAGRSADIVMVNSSWTEEHINQLWSCALNTHRVYPPCDVDDLKSIPLARKGDGEGGDDGEEEEIRIVSVSQFRPEKDHPLQIRSLFQLREMLDEDTFERIRLVFVGSCRNEEDKVRVKDMQDLCKHFSLENNVEFKVNVSYDELKRELGKGLIGLHAMWNEHFGISVVECMAAGQIMVAHRSGGPLMDIVMEYEGCRNGFLASEEAEYAHAIATILSMTPAARNKLREAARASVDRFSTKEFEKAWLRAVDPFFSQSQRKTS